MRSYFQRTKTKKDNTKKGNLGIAFSYHLRKNYFLRFNFLIKALYLSMSVSFR